MQPLPFDRQPLDRDRAGLPVATGVDLRAEAVAGRDQRRHVRVGVEQVGFGGHQVGLGDPHVASEPPLDSGSNGTHVATCIP